MYGLFLLLLLYYTLLYPTSSPKKISNRNFIVCTRLKVGPSVRRSSLFRVPATLQFGFLVNQFVGLTVHRSVGPSLHPTSIYRKFQLNFTSHASDSKNHSVGSSVLHFIAITRLCIGPSVRRSIGHWSASPFVGRSFCKKTNQTSITAPLLRAL